MDPLGDQLTTRPIQTGWEFSMERYPSGQFGFIDDHDCQCGNGSVWTRARTRSDGPEPWLTLNIAILTICDQWIVFLKLPLAKTVHLGNTRPDIIHHMGTITLPHGSHFHTLLSFTCILYSTWLLVCHHAQVQGKDFQHMGHRGQYMISTKATMVGLNCST